MRERKEEGGRRREWREGKGSCGYVGKRVRRVGPIKTFWANHRALFTRKKANRQENVGRHSDASEVDRVIGLGLEGLEEHYPELAVGRIFRKPIRLGGSCWSARLCFP